jgi:pimeloyl-ACP methyl ester carboxylesterase
MTPTLAYDDCGSGFPLVLIHGHPFNRSMWRPQVEAFQDNYRVVAPDLRGYGASPVIPGKTLLSDFAQDIAALLNTLLVPRCVIAGLSLGGQIVLEFYRQFPERVAGLVLADTFATLDTPEVKQNRYKTAERLLREGMKAYSVEVLPKMMAPANIAANPETANHVLEMMQHTSPQGAAAALTGRAERQDYTGLLATISVPTLIVVGSLDEFTPVPDAQFMHDRIPGSILQVIDGAGHMPNLERVSEFNAALGAFLGRIA